MVPSGLTNIVLIAAGDSHSLALRGDGKVIGWGDNFFGQRRVPTGLANIVAIAAGSEHSLALRADGTVIAWGRNDSGQTTVPASLTNVVAIAAGYESIEIHGAHGYLPMAFMSPRKNTRDDEWGGDFERRLAFPVAIVCAIKAVLGPSRPLIYRVSAAEFVESGLSIDDMQRIVPLLARAGCDALHVSTGAVEGARDKIVDPMSSREGWRFPLGRRLRDACGLPVIAVGPVRWPESAERALAAGDADLIALGRPLLADPFWASKAKAGRLEDITPCTNCNWCMARLREHAAIGCAENPRTGRELESLTARSSTPGTSWRRPFGKPVSAAKSSATRMRSAELVTRSTPRMRPCAS